MKKPSVLCVERDPRLSEIIGGALADRGLAVRQARTIAEARRKLARSAPSILLLDSTMEGALPWIKELRVDPKTAPLSIASYTHEGTRLSVDALLKQGVQIIAFKTQTTPEDLGKRLSEIRLP